MLLFTYELPINRYGRFFWENKSRHGITIRNTPDRMVVDITTGPTQEDAKGSAQYMQERFPH